MKKLFVTIIAGVCMMGFTSCEQDQVFPNDTIQSKTKPQSFITSELQGPVAEPNALDESLENDKPRTYVLNEAKKPVSEPTLSIVFDIDETVQSIED